MFGKVNFSAKLPITFAKSDADLPHARIFGMDYQPGNGGLPEHWVAEEKKVSFPADYSEGVRFGYKWFDSEGKQPLFPFGFGLSYTRYTYGALAADSALGSATFKVTNSGQCAGTEIAEVYVQLPPSSGEHFRRLAGWQRVTLEPGESKSVTVPLERLAWASFNESKDAWGVASGPICNLGRRLVAGSAAACGGDGALKHWYDRASRFEGSSLTPATYSASTQTHTQSRSTAGRGGPGVIVVDRRLCFWPSAGFLRG